MKMNSIPPYRKAPSARCQLMLDHVADGASIANVEILVDMLEVVEDRVKVARLGHKRTGVVEVNKINLVKIRQTAVSSKRVKRLSHMQEILTTSVTKTCDCWRASTLIKNNRES